MWEAIVVHTGHSGSIRVQAKGSKERSHGLCRGLLHLPCSHLHLPLPNPCLLFLLAPAQPDQDRNLSNVSE